MTCIQVATIVAAMVWVMAMVTMWVSENKEYKAPLLFVRYTAWAVAMVLIIIQTVGVAKVAERIDRMFS